MTGSGLAKALHAVRETFDMTPNTCAQRPKKLGDMFVQANMERASPGPLQRLVRRHLTAALPGATSRPATLARVVFSETRPT